MINQTIRYRIIFLYIFIFNCVGINAQLNENEFRYPPSIAKPHTFYHWMNGNVTREGVKKDLEAMRRVGIGGFHVFDVGTSIPKGHLNYKTKDWTDLIRYTAFLADSLGLDFSMHNSSGWSSSGGPWVRPEQGMQQLVWTETVVEGDGSLKKIKLKQPYSNHGYYKDDAVIAFPSHFDHKKNFLEKIKEVKLSSETVVKDSLFDEDWNTGINIREADTSSDRYNVVIEMKEPHIASHISILITRMTANDGGDCIVEGSEDNVQFNKLTQIPIPSRYQTVRVPAVRNFDRQTSKFYRLSFTFPVRVEELELSDFSNITEWTAKANFIPYRLEREVQDQDKPANKNDIVDPASVINLEKLFNDNGELSWNIPKGKWIILRMGYTVIEAYNTPASDSGRGLEINKFSKEAMDYHFDKMFGEIIPLFKKLGKASVGALIDSYERGVQNWTAGFPALFKKYNNYDILGYLPAMTGRIVGDRKISDKFLWDLRAVQAHLMTENYYGRFSELCRKNNMVSYTEPYGGPFENMEAGSKSDINLGEFWQGKGDGFTSSIKLVSSIAHIYGKPIVGSEAFTSTAKWETYPYSIKALGDKMFTRGTNKFTFHTFTSQPHSSAVPGMTMGPWGSHFDRNNTWFEKSGPWIDYITRSQHLLQQGLFVADVAYYTGVNVENRQGRSPKSLEPELAYGYDFDLINTDVILNKVLTKENKIILPDGMNYHLLVLSQDGAMTHEVLAKVFNLLKNGAWIYGPKPKFSPSLRDDEKKMLEIADFIWGEGETKTVEKKIGKGKLFWGQPINWVLAQKGVTADFIYSSERNDTTRDLNYIHRRVKDAEMYFVANESDQYKKTVLSFRVNDKSPEIWDAHTGKIYSYPVFSYENGRVNIPYTFDPSGAAFFIFRKSSKPQYTNILKDGETIYKGNHFANLSPDMKIAPVVDTGFTMSHTFLSMPLVIDQSSLDLNKGRLIFWKPGKYIFTGDNSRKKTIGIPNIPAPKDISSNWQVDFPKNLGAPSSIKLDKLISLSDHSLSGVKYFSGTMSYKKEIVISSGELKNYEMYLDLGRVMVVAEVILNDHNLGTLWTLPLRTNLTPYLKPGTNKLEIKVTNLWPNRLIGDEQLPAESNYRDDKIFPKNARVFFTMGGIIALPDWFVNNQPKKGDRITFSTWHHYYKNSRLPESGLIGPVKIMYAKKF